MNFRDMTPEQRKAISKRGGKARAKTLTSEHQRMARAHVKRESLQRSGRKGFIACGGKRGWLKANRKASAWRIQHPSAPEQWAIAKLNAADVNYTREFEYDDDGHTLDFAAPPEKISIEINGHQDHAAFGETESRAAKHARKVEAARALGWTVFVVSAYDDAALSEAIAKMPKAQAFDEIPF